MDEKKHRAIVKAHLPISKVLDILLPISLRLNPTTEEMENNVISENKKGDSEKGTRVEFNPYPPG